MRLLTVLLAIAVFFFTQSALAGFGGEELFIASVGQGPGVGTSEWKTTIWVNNPGQQAADCEVSFLVRNQANPDPDAFMVTIQPGDTRVWEDTVPTLFGTDGFGALMFKCSAEVIVNSRIFNDPGDDPSNTQGQFFNAIPSTFAIGSGESTDVLGVNQDSSDAFRYNFGFVETTGQTVSVLATLVDGDGSVLGTKSYFVRGYEPVQFNVADLGAGSAPTGNGRLRIEVSSGSGKIIVFGSGIANTSQDPSTFEMTMHADSVVPGEGDITAVYAEGGLAGGGESGAVTLRVAGAGITADKVAPGAVTSSHLSAQGSTAGQVLTSSGTAVSWQDPAGGSGSGDISAVIAGDGLTGGGTTGDVTLSLADSGVTTAKLADAAVTGAKIQDASVTNVEMSIDGAMPGQVLKYVCDSVIWADDLDGGLDLPFTATTTEPAFLLNLTNVSTSSAGGVIRAKTTGGDGLFVSQLGSGSAATFECALGNSHPVVEVRSYSTGQGILVRQFVEGGSAGRFNSGLTSNSAPVLLAETGSTTTGASAVKGVAEATAGTTYAVLGNNASYSSNAAGVRGEGYFNGTQGVSSATSGETAGVWGWAASSDGAGVLGHSNNGFGVVGRSLGDWNWRSGVYGEAAMAHANGVTGWNTGSGIGVYAWSQTGTAIVAKGGGGHLMEVYERSSDNLRFRVDNDGQVYADGSFHSGGADFAELYPAAEALEPGTVVAIGPDGNAVRATAERASAVMGVVATSPSIVGNSPAGRGAREGHVPVAILGIVDVKATSRSGKILPGDLLTAGQVPGTAEKAVWAYPGTIIGKALEPLEADAGTIRILVTLR